MLRMILLGVGTAVPDPDRENTHMVWESPSGLLLVDAGGSTYQRLLRAKLDPLSLRGVFLTHAHADHINGLAALLFQLSLAGYQGMLRIYGNEPTLALMQRVVAAFELGEHQAPVEWVTVVSGQEVPLGDPQVRVLTQATVHSAPCLGLRFEECTTGKALVYAGDTEPHEASVSFAKGASVLIHEATVPEPFPGHTTPRQAGKIAAEAGVGRLALVHFSPRWTMSAAQAIEEVRIGGFVGEAEIGREFGEYFL
ncbi:MBL fold metallo-hydrolase [Chloroflexia bacterium SDU3-3]|nr:MBL fold metallo-hydrolase [Chloroflexia bacterium SDU3-3]